MTDDTTSSGGVDGALAGRTALVTGGGTGLGAAITRALHGAGASVVITGRRAEPLAALAAELARVEHRVCDVADPASVVELATSLSAHEI
ncbi:MAG TPA: SDR family NAD(P)-dependent oxidoreductase, partial [Microlunatus sp.]|nr:SDR family NAD(P)-dependent oxidoreductase [Microlunatus sp.]